MRLLLVLFTLLMSLNSIASTELLAEVRVGDDPVNVWLTEFELNRTKDRVRARIIFEEVDTRPDSDNSYEEFGVAIKGLNYEPSTKTVYVEREGRRIDCGYFYNKRWVIDLGKSFWPTGNCNFVTKRVTQHVDDGFNYYGITKLQVHFEIVE